MKIYIKSVLTLALAGAAAGALAEKQVAVEDSETVHLLAQVDEFMEIELSEASINITSDMVGHWHEWVHASVRRRGADAGSIGMPFEMEVTSFAGANGKDYKLNMAGGSKTSSGSVPQLDMRIGYTNAVGGGASISPLLDTDLENYKFTAGEKREMRTALGLSSNSREAGNDRWNVGLRFRIDEESIRNAVPGNYTTTMLFTVTAK